MTIALRDIGWVQAVVRQVDRATEGVKLNEVGREWRGGRVGFIKRRNGYSWGLAKVANFYFWMARVPIRFLSGKAWQRWEAGCFRMVNEDMEASAVGEDGVWADEVPGKSLFEHLKEGTLRGEMLMAAGREFRRCHGRWSEELRGEWSHGDATMSNVLYDDRRGRARFIDFEIVHVKGLGADQRHADDLLVFLLDLSGFAPEHQWLEMAGAFLEGYGDERVVEVLRGKLRKWRGMARIWWGVRTNFVEGKKMERRLATLRVELTVSPRKTGLATDRHRQTLTVGLWRV